MEYFKFFPNIFHRKESNIVNNRSKEKHIKKEKVNALKNFLCTSNLNERYIHMIKYLLYIYKFLIFTISN